MNKYKNNKKGFTIVELVIVIAVIAILSAVLIPTFSGLIKKANVTADQTLVRNLNTTLAIASEGKNGKPTMYETLKDIEKEGYVVSRLTPTSAGSEIVWDSEKNQFVLVMKDGKYYTGTTYEDYSEEDYYKLWKIYNDKNNVDKSKYSVYLSSENGAVTGEVTVNGVGFDAGDNTGITKVTYNSDNDKTNTIRTNGGELVVNAPNGTVKHYEKADKVTVTAVAGNSYHEYGKVVGDLEIVKGRVELSSSAEVSTIFVSSATAGDVKVDVANGAQVTAVVPTTEVAKNDIQSSTTIPTESKVNTVTPVNKDFAGGLGTEKSPYLISNGEQFNNINKLSDELSNGKSYYFKQISDIVVSNVYNGKGFAGGYDGSNYKLIANFSNNNNCVCLFNTKASKGYMSFKNMNIVMNKVAVSLLRTADWGTSFGASFDNLVFDSTEALITTNVNNFGFVLINAIYTVGTNGTNSPVYNFSNIVNNVNLQNEGTCTGFIVGSGPCFNVKTTLNYSNCVNNGEITGTSSIGYLYGNYAYIKEIKESDIIINVDNCKNSRSGKFQSVSDSLLVKFAPTPTDKNSAELESVKAVKALNEQYQKEAGGSFLNNNYFNKNNSVKVNQDGTKFTINTKDNSVKYKLAFNVSAIYSTISEKDWTTTDVGLIENKKNNEDAYNKVWNVSNGNKFLIDLPIDETATGELCKKFKAYDKKTARENGINVSEFTDGYAFIVKDGVVYMIFDTTPNVYINSAVSLIVYVYESNNKILGIKPINK